MKCKMMFLVCMACAIRAVAAPVLYTESCNGELWTFTLSGGHASVGGGSGIPAIEGSGHGELVIPDSLGGCPVTNIAVYAFAEKANICRVVLPDTLVSIGADAFRSCRSITNIVWGKNVATVGTDAFWGCSQIRKVDVADLAR